MPSQPSGSGKVLRDRQLAEVREADDLVQVVPHVQGALSYKHGI